MGRLSLLGAGKQKVGAAFLPTDIAGLTMWYDFSDATTLFTDAGSTLVSGDGDAIHQANDLSGNNRHLLAYNTTTGKPLYKTGIKNGLSVSRFDGSDDVLRYYNAADTSLIDIQSSTIITVFQCAVDFAHVHQSRILDNARYYIGTRGVTIGDNTRINYNVVGASFVVVSAICNGSTKTAYVNSALEGTKTDANTGTQNVFFVGGGTANIDHVLPTVYVACDVAETIVYNSALSDGDRSSIDLYINNKWGLY